MKRNVAVSLLSSVLACVVLLMIAASVGAQGPDGGAAQPIGPTTLTGTPISSTFTYQGQLNSNGNAVTGPCNFQFGLWDAASVGLQVGVTQTLTTVTVTSGQFSVLLDFGPTVFNGDARWLQLAVQCGSDAGFTALNPRQALTPTPYAVYATDSHSAAALQSRAVAATAPTTGQVLKWNGNAWVPDVDNTGSGGSTYSNGFGLNLIGNVFSVLTSTIQARVSGVCGAGFAMRTIGAEEVEERGCQIDQKNGERRKDRIDQKMPMSERVPGKSERGEEGH